MDFSDDLGLVAVLASFEVDPQAKLGHGGEAWVYALDDARVLRVLHPGGDAEELCRRQRLVDELKRAAPPFALPEMLEVGELDGRVFAIERRLSGRSVLDELHEADGGARVRVIEAHLDVAAALGDLHLGPRDGYGDLLHADGRSITAVIDIGTTSAAGDRRLDPVAAAVYLASPEISGVATPPDVDVAMSWLRSAGLADWFEPASRWLAAYWSFAVDDPAVLAWCRRILIGLR